jgi:hypothetical protein
MYEIVRDNYTVAEFGTMSEAVEHIKFLPDGRYIVRHWRADGDDTLIAPRLGNFAINKQ